MQLFCIAHDYHMTAALRRGANNVELKRRKNIDHRQGILMRTPPNFEPINKHGIGVA